MFFFFVFFFFFLFLCGFNNKLLINLYGLLVCASVVSYVEFVMSLFVPHHAFFLVPRED